MCASHVAAEPGGCRAAAAALSRPAAGRRCAQKLLPPAPPLARLLIPLSTHAEPWPMHAPTDERDTTKAALQMQNVRMEDRYSMDRSAKNVRGCYSEGCIFAPAWPVCAGHKLRSCCCLPAGDTYMPASRCLPPAQRCHLNALVWLRNPALCAPLCNCPGVRRRRKASTRGLLCGCSTCS